MKGRGDLDIEALLGSLPLRQIGHLSWDIVPVLILGDEARAQHIGESLLLFGRHLRLGLGVSELLLEAVDRREFVLEGLRLGLRRHLRVEDLLAPSASRRGSFHPVGQQRF